MKKAIIIISLALSFTCCKDNTSRRYHVVYTNGDEDNVKLRGNVYLSDNGCLTSNGYKVCGIRYYYELKH